MVLVLSFTDFCGTTYLRVDQIFGWQNIFHPVINSISFTPPWALSFNRAGLGTRVLGGLHFCLLLAWAMAVAWRCRIPKMANVNFSSSCYIYAYVPLAMLAYRSCWWVDTVVPKIPGNGLLWYLSWSRSLHLGQHFESVGD